MKLLSLILTCLCGAPLCLADSEPDKPITVRVAAYNVEFGKSATPEEIGEMLKPYKLDIIGFDEAPDGDWTARVGKVLGMPHSFVGKISSANHKDKYKTILSRTALENTEEHTLTGRGWNPASVVRAVTKIDGVSFAFYSLHISGSKANEGHAHSLATEVLNKETTERVIVVGDFNNNIGDASMKTIEDAGFSPTWNDLEIDLSREFTYNAQDPKKNNGVIDHIFYNTSAGAKATDGAIIELKTPLSDHKPIWSQIVFPRDLKKAAGVQAASHNKEESTTKLRVVAYNVACGQWATPEQIAELLKPLNADIVLLSEVPKANRGEKVKDWSLRVAEALGLEHAHVGTVSSANHKSPDWGDVTGQYGGKFKSILSRTPLTGAKDILVEGSGWRRASAVRVETEIAGRKLALYSLHLPGYAHNKRQPTTADAWEGSKHHSLAEHIKAEDASYDVIVGGDFNEWTDSVVMSGLLKSCNLENATKEKSIDHILYSQARPIKLLEAKRDWGPKNQNDTNEKADGCLSDHPWVWCELEISKK